MQFSFAVLRAIVGGLFFGHGMQKLAGWFGGQGMEGTARSFESMRLRPGVAHAAAAGAAEAGGGVLVLAGAATPLGAAAISGSMITAVRKVHGPKGPWITNGGYEYNLVLLALVFALTGDGPGRFSLDALWGRRRWGLRWALAELGAGALGSMLAVAIGERADRAAAVEDPGEPGGDERERPQSDGKVAASAL